MRTILEFKLVVYAIPEEVEKQVNALVQQKGFELYGSPFSSPHTYGQALVRYAPDEPQNSAGD